MPMSLTAMAKRAGIAASAILALSLGTASCQREDYSNTGSTSDEPMPASVAALYPNTAAAEDAWAGSNLFKRDLLRDGDLTYAEYEAAVMTFAQCARDAGVVFLKEPTYDQASRAFDYSMQIGARGDESATSEQNINTCETQYLRGIPAVWNWLHRSTEADLQAGDAALRECLRELGEDSNAIIAVPPYGSQKYTEWAMARLDEERKSPSVDAPAWLRCINRIETEYPVG